MENKSWLGNLAPGDKVIVNRNQSSQVHIVDRITPTGRIVINGLSYAPNGSILGRDTHGFSWLTEATPEKVKKITDAETVGTAKRWADTISRHDFTLTPEQADEFLAMITRWKNE